MNFNTLLFTHDLINVLSEFIAITLIQRYVFLEPGLKDAKKQRIYLIIITILILASNILFGETASLILIILSSGCNIVMGRLDILHERYPKTYLIKCLENKYLDKQYCRERNMAFHSAVLIVPITGIASGLIAPILFLPTSLFQLSEKTTDIYQIIIYITYAVCLITYYFFGNKFRHNFSTGIGTGHVQPLEKALLCITGLLMLFVSSIISKPVYEYETSYGHEAAIVYGRTVGILGVIAFILTLSVIILTVISNQRSYLNNKVADMQFNIITVMADIVENRDENTGGHIKRTAKYVDIIGKELMREGKFPETLTESYLKDMSVAAPLHDIGKIHVSDVVLNKPGRLTDEEFDQMKTHTSAGKKLLISAREQIGDFSYLDIAIDMAGSHHEWWDGNPKGYPEGLSGEDIPLCARIMAVADVFDALISKRCYKTAMPLEKAYQIMKEESGTHFDPIVSEAFFNAQDEIEAALAKFEE